MTLALGRFPREFMSERRPFGMPEVTPLRWQYSNRQKSTPQRLSAETYACYHALWIHQVETMYGKQRSCIVYKRLSHLVPLRSQRKSG
jgi:hypothetical protein